MASRERGAGNDRELAAAVIAGAAVASLRDGEAETSAQADAAAALILIHEDSWWGKATTEQIISAFETGCAWQNSCEWASRAIERIRADVMGLYRLDALSPSADAAAVEAALMDRRSAEREAIALDLTDAAQALARAHADARQDQARQATLRARATGCTTAPGTASAWPSGLTRARRRDRDGRHAPQGMA